MTLQTRFGGVLLLSLVLCAIASASAIGLDRPVSAMVSMSGHNLNPVLATHLTAAGTARAESYGCHGPGSLSPGCTSMYYLRDPSDIAIFTNNSPGLIYAESTGWHPVGVTMRCGSRATQASVPPEGCLFLNLVGKPDLCFVSLWSAGNVNLYACFNEWLLAVYE